MLPLSSQTFALFRIRPLISLSVKPSPETVSLVQDTFPGKPGLKTFERQHFKKIFVVRAFFRKFSPFIVVVGDIFWIFQVAPVAARKILVKNFFRPEVSGRHFHPSQIFGSRPQVAAFFPLRQTGSFRRNWFSKSFSSLSESSRYANDA